MLLLISCKTQPVKDERETADIYAPALPQPPIADFYNILDENNNITYKAIPFDYYVEWAIWTGDVENILQVLIPPKEE